MELWGLTIILDFKIVEACKNCALGYLFALCAFCILQDHYQNQHSCKFFVLFCKQSFSLGKWKCVQEDICAFVSFQTDVLEREIMYHVSQSTFYYEGISSDSIAEFNLCILHANFLGQLNTL